MFCLLSNERSFEINNIAQEHNFCDNSSYILQMELKEMTNFLSTNSCFLNLKNRRNTNKFHDAMFPKTDVVGKLFDGF